MSDFARDLRGRSTLAEQTLWKAVRGRRLAGLKFRRQHPVGGYVADFYCDAARMIVELDGGVHDDPEQVLRDGQRRCSLEASGFFVIRFRNEVGLTRLTEVLEEIERRARAGEA